MLWPAWLAPLPMRTMGWRRYPPPPPFSPIIATPLIIICLGLLRCHLLAFVLEISPLLHHSLQREGGIAASCGVRRAACGCDCSNEAAGTSCVPSPTLSPFILSPTRFPSLLPPPSADPRSSDKSYSSWVLPVFSFDPCELSHSTRGSANLIPKWIACPLGLSHTCRTGSRRPYHTHLPLHLFSKNRNKMTPLRSLSLSYAL